jgi:hypothetical protein
LQFKRHKTAWLFFPDMFERETDTFWRLGAQTKEANYMANLARKISIVFGAGCLGGLANSLGIWVCGFYGITAAFGVKIAPQLSAPWLYPRIVWGGIWGLLFLLPLWQKRFLIRGLIFSLGPTLVQLFIVFPMQANKGVMGLDLGSLTPVAVIVFNAIWGLTAAIWLRWTKYQA